MSNLYLGMISGTSVDGVDCVLADFGDRRCEIVAARTHAYPPALRDRVESLIRAPQASLAEIGALDVACGRFFAECALTTIAESGRDRSEIDAIGHHGQTVFHAPDGDEAFTMQLGDASTVAALTGITTVGDIRAMDMALGGQGAPMVPAFHAWLFSDPDEARVIANIGGIANVTTLVPDRAPTGFDTGPGNTLMDLWIERCRQESFDRDGRWAASGTPVPALLESMLADPYFALEPPKSTGRERFHAEWLDRHLAGLAGQMPAGPAEADVQATLAELTVVTLTSAVTKSQLSAASLIVCGGGAHNGFLLERLAAVHDGTVTTTTQLGLEPDWVEGAAFAWLAHARLHGIAGNVPTVTGARQGAMLGGIYSRDTP